MAGTQHGPELAPLLRIHPSRQIRPSHPPSLTRPRLGFGAGSHRFHKGSEVVGSAAAMLSRISQLGARLLRETRAVGPADNCGNEDTCNEKNMPTAICSETLGPADNCRNKDTCKEKNMPTAICSETCTASKQRDYDFVQITS